MKIIREMLQKLELGPAAEFTNLTMFPLLGNAGQLPVYATLDEAIKHGWVEVSEITTAGSVPELKVANKGDRAVFMMDGEELVGAKQNRVLNLTILVPAGQTLVIPVSCVEQGRWAARSFAMAASPDALYANARMAKMRSVSTSYKRFRRPTSDQVGLWQAIGSKAHSLGVMSKTGAMSDIYERHQRRVSDYERAFEAVEGQCGAMFAIGDRLVGFEVFEHPDMLRKMLRKVVRSYALDAIDAAESKAVPDEEAARAFLSEVAEGEAETFPAVGMGQDVRITGPRMTAAALVDNERVVHLCAFRTDGDEREETGPGRIGRMVRASQRRR